MAKRMWFSFCRCNIASLGVGYEVVYAENLGKPIYAIYEKDANVSGFLRGNGNIEFLAYSNLDEAMDKIDEICS